MFYKKILFIMCFSLIASNLFSDGRQERTVYHIENLSGEDLYYTLINRNKFGDYRGREYRDEDNNIITISINEILAPHEKIKGHIIPGPYGEGRPPVLTEIHSPLVYVNGVYSSNRVLSGAAIMNIILDTLIIYDAGDSIIMTLDDLDENSFHRSTYGRFVMTITEETVRRGREKYADTATNNGIDVRKLFVPGEINVEVTPPEFMIQIENSQTIQPAPNYTFTDKEGNFQLRYTFFKQTEKDVGDIRMLYLEFLYLLYSEIKGQDERYPWIYSWWESSVQEEHNGDFRHGLWENIIYYNSDFSDGFDMGGILFHYKYNEGIVMQTFLYRNRHFYNETHNKIRRTFRFLN